MLRILSKAGAVSSAWMVLVAGFSLGVGTFSVTASQPQNPSDTCIASAQEAAIQTGVPLSVLLAITLTETGRKKAGAFSPWPWTVNMQGAGKWLKSRAEAIKFAKDGFDRGARSFDVGCFQLNYKWHGAAFRSIEHMFEPAANANYAARYLAELFQEKGNWDAAAGAYHSRTPIYANRYKKRFHRIRARLDADSGQDTTTTALATRMPLKTRVNTFPLLANLYAGRSTGSLVPLSGSAPAQGLIVHTSEKLF